MIRKLFNRFSPSPEPRIAALMYHRIVTPATDPWQLAVSPANFEKQLRALKNSFSILTLAELTEQITNKSIKQDSVFLSFDDAYADNYYFAKPILESYACPATFFIPTHYVEQAKGFWWDELETYILQTGSLPLKMSIEINDQRFKFELKRDTPTKREILKQRSWIWHQEPPTERCALYLKLWEQLKPLPDEEIKHILQQIRQWSGGENPSGGDRSPMSVSQLREIAEHPLFTLGVHTKTHPALAYHTKEAQHAEISGCKDFLERNFNDPIHSIAYPYGNYNDTTLEVTQENGISVGFTTDSEPITLLSNPLCLGRLQILNWKGRGLVRQVKKLLHQ